MRLALLAVIGLSTFCASASGETVFIDASHHIRGSVTSDGVTESYDQTSGGSIDGRVDGAFGNYAESSAGRLYGTVYAVAESVELSSSEASGRAFAFSETTFQTTETSLTLRMWGEVSPPDGVSVTINDVQTGDLVFQTSQMATGDAIESWSLSPTIAFDPSHQYLLTIDVRNPGYEPMGLTRNSAYVELYAAPLPPAAWGGLALLAAVGAGHLLRRRLA